MSEWHKDPDWILDNWTDDYLDLMVRKRNQRVQGDDGEEASARSPVVPMDDLKKASLARFQVWKDLSQKKA